MFLKAKKAELCGVWNFHVSLGAVSFIHCCSGWKTECFAILFSENKTKNHCVHVGKVYMPTMVIILLYVHLIFKNSYP
jgi:hypothetical protein